MTDTKFALTNIPTPPPPDHVNRNTIMAVGTEDLTILENYMVERKFEGQMVNCHFSTLRDLWLRTSVASAR